MSFNLDDYIDMIAPPKSIISIIKNFFEFKGLNDKISSKYTYNEYNKMIWSFTSIEENDYKLPKDININLYSDNNYSKHIPFYKCAFYITGNNFDIDDINIKFKASGYAKRTENEFDGKTDEEINNIYTNANIAYEEYFKECIYITKHQLDSNVVRINILINDKLDFHKELNSDKVTLNNITNYSLMISNTNDDSEIIDIQGVVY